MPRRWRWYTSFSDFVSRGYELLDIQQLTPHTAQFGAIEIPRTEYLRRLANACCKNVTFGDRGPETLQFAAF